MQDIFAFLVSAFGWRVVAAMVGLDHEGALLSEGRKDSSRWRLVLVYNLVRIRELLP